MYIYVKVFSLQEMENDVATYVMHELDKCVCSWEDHQDLGIRLRVPISRLQRVRNENPHNIGFAAFQIVLWFYQTTGGSKEEKMQNFYRALCEMKPNLSSPFAPREPSATSVGREILYSRAPSFPPGFF